MTGLRVADKVILISGAGGVKGRELAKRLVGDGARLIVTDLHLDRAMEVADSVGEANSIRAMKLDVSREEDWGKVVQSIRDNERRLDSLINSARHIFVSKVHELSLADWRQSAAVNFDGPFLGAKHCLSLLVASGGGTIINIVSLSALQPNDQTPAYAAGNAASFNLLRTIALQYADQNIRANALVLGFSANSPLDDTYEIAKRLVPLGRPNTGSDIANAALWLVSDEAAYMTGTTIVLDGGRSAGMRIK